VLRTTERPAHLAKNRLRLPDELPLSWAEFAKHLPASCLPAPTAPPIAIPSP